MDKLCIGNNTYIDSSCKLSGNIVIGNNNNGITSLRPSSNIEVGFCYFDTTLNKPIWWTGTKWVDATGADV